MSGMSVSHRAIQPKTEALGGESLARLDVWGSETGSQGLEEEVGEEEQTSTRGATQEVKV